MAKSTSCGVIVTDGERLLLGHAARSPRWDIPKGMAEAGENFASAAVRELKEETSLVIPAEALSELGVYSYMPGKNLALFALIVPEMPPVEGLKCHSTFSLPSGASLPELDRFGIYEWESAVGMVGKNLARILAEVRPKLATKIKMHKVSET